MESTDQIGSPSYYACPECGGVLNEIEGGDAPRFRCHVGHGFSTQALLASQDDGLEYALWAAVRILEEKTHFYRRLAQRQTPRLSLFAERLSQKAAEANRHAAVIRQMLESGAVATLNESPEDASQN
jgi:two-component system chemotaxis response regulator CheB